MRSPLHVAAKYQRAHNASGTRFVLVNDRVYPTDNPQRYITTIKRNHPGQVYRNLGECNANGTLLQVQINW